MKPADNIKNLFRKLRVPASAEFDQRIHSGISKALTESETTTPAVLQPGIGRIIMKSQITKLAAAAAIIIAAIGVIHYFGGSIDMAGKVYGITDLPELLQNARTLHYKAWSYFPEDTGTGKVQRRVALENWYDFEKGFYRTMSAGYNNVPENTSLILQETVWDGQYAMGINHTEKSVTFSKPSPFLQKLDAYQHSHEFKTQMLGDPQKLDNFSRTGEEVIDGTRYDIWEGQTEFPFHEPLRVKSWISPTTGDIARIEQDFITIRHEIQKVERNIDISLDVFATKPPQGYTLLNTKETAENIGLEGGSTCYQDSLSVTINITFSLPDGSVILAWHSEDTQSDTSQASIFESLKPGDNLPKLPIEIYALKSMGGGKSITYNGQHLSYTHKAGKFYEWSIYVPLQTPPSRDDFIGYFPMPRFNIPKDRVLFSFGVQHDVVIENEQDFSTWVLGAMAELNDNGKTIENLTYQDVLQLSQKIRQSQTQ
jgi:hypothetical protein